jgi:tetratricopeptide (TPR) repeat protein
MNALIDQYPIVTDYYDFAANTLLDKKEFDGAYSFLTRRFEIEPDAFSAKWIGTISLYRNQPAEAEKYLNQSLKLNDKDSQAWYNLAGVFVQEKDYRRALESVNKALALNPHYPEGITLQKRLQEVLK